MSGRRKVRVAVALVALLVVASAVTIALTQTSRNPEPDRVKIEIRARPLATIRFKGKNLGHTPLTIQLPRGTREQTLEATFRTVKINPVLQKKHTEIRTLTQTFVPDAHQSVDFDVIDAKLERVDEAPMSAR